MRFMTIHIKEKLYLHDIYRKKIGNLTYTVNVYSLIINIVNDEHKF